EDLVVGNADPDAAVEFGKIAWTLVGRVIGDPGGLQRLNISELADCRLEELEETREKQALAEIPAVALLVTFDGMKKERDSLVDLVLEIIPRLSSSHAGGKAQGIGPEPDQDRDRDRHIARPGDDQRRREGATIVEVSLDFVNQLGAGTGLGIEFPEIGCLPNVGYDDHGHRALATDQAAESLRRRSNFLPDVVLAIPDKSPILDLDVAQERTKATRFLDPTGGPEDKLLVVFQSDGAVEILECLGSAELGLLDVFL